ncbi:hypothetical protein [Roseinatronobacter sp.]|uniref:hypothetical protein n=1 Tax=Roseinatronobacter sp. TaxID=1945755 RepID=UPI0025D8ECF9|nr:hypothetical protein [Roseibaca sp.]
MTKRGPTPSIKVQPMTVTEAADQIGVNRNTLRNWLKMAGMNSADGVLLPEFLKWKFRYEREQGFEEASKKFEGITSAGDIEGVISLEEAKRRRAVADAAIREIDLDERAEKVAPIDVMQQQFADVLGRARERLYDIPGACAPDLVSMDDAVEIEELLMSRIDDAVTEFNEQESKK